MDLRMAFTEDAANYDRYRPAYPKELFLEIAEYTPLGKDSRALEIGIGTGQATLPILNTGCAVTAVELGRELHDYVKKKFSGHDRFEAVHADFMNVLPGGNAFDLVYCATAFHWLPAGEGYRRVMDCLKPGGALALFWNHPYPNRQNDAGNLVNRRIYAKYRPSGGEPVEFSERDCGERRMELKRYGFTDIRTKLYRRVRTLSSGDYIGLLNTYSDHRTLPPAPREAFEKEMKATLDGIGGRINIYDTIDLYLGRKP